MPALVYCAAVSSALPQTEVARPVSDIIRKDGADLLRLTGYGFTSPLRWDAQDALMLGGVAAGTVASSTLDDEVYDIMSRNHTLFNDKLDVFFEAYGNGLTAAVLAGTLYTGGLAFENSWMRETGIVLASAIVVAAGTNTVLKYAAGRARPYTNLGNDVFHPFVFKSGFVSLASGHTAVAFTVSSVLARRIDNIWASIALYAAATFGGVARLYSRNHWLSDDVLAAALGISVSHSLVSWYEGGMPSPEAGFQIIPRSDGVSFVWRF
ncbi:MAG: phosphatase PAP2 family protein [Ignavibacteriae bacterium]|nr:phosphatase PAP2 family protein [Ignavibacteriota bacterium]